MIVTSSRIKLIAVIVIALGLLASYYPSFSKSIGFAAQETKFNDDVRQYIWPTFVYAGESPFKDDYVADSLFGLMPVGYKADPGIYAGTSISAAFAANQIAAFLSRNPQADKTEISNIFGTNPPD